MYVLAIDIGILNMGLVESEVNLEYELVKITFADCIDLTTLQPYCSI